MRRRLALTVVFWLLLHVAPGHAQFDTMLGVAALSSHPGGVFTTTQTNPTGTLNGVWIHTTTGPCLVYNDGGTHTIEASEIGPCGDNNTTNDSTGVEISGGTTVNIYDNYIHVENQSSNCSTFYSHDNILVNGNGTAVVDIQGSVVAYGQSNIDVFNSSNVSVIGNFLLNPRGNVACTDADNVGRDQFQSNGTTPGGNTGLVVSSNYTVSALTGYLYPANSSDQINFSYASGMIVENNWINGSQYIYSCGITIDYGSVTATIESNIISNTYNCGIGIATGTNHTISTNKIEILAGSVSAAGITLVGANNSPAACNTIALTSNLSYAIQSGGYVQGYNTDGYCSSVTLTSNTFDVGCTTGVNCAAYAALNPIATTNPPPLIPPLPKNCVVGTPWTTQTSKTRCP